MLCRLLIFVLLTVACQSYAAIEVIDDNGDWHRLDKPANRIISLSPSTTEILFYIGAGEQIVGADEYSNYPQQANQIPRVNNHATANYELILSLKPDLVIAWQSGNGQKIIERIRQLGIPVFVVEPSRVDAIPMLFKRLGQLSGHSLEAHKKAAAYAEQLQLLRRANQHKPEVRVFYEVWHDPLITLNGRHIVSDVIELCGGVNTFADSLALVPYVNIESVLALDPQIIIAGGEKDRLSLLARWEKWRSLSAVKNKHLYSISSDLMQRHAGRFLDGVELVCEYIDRARVGENIPASVDSNL